MSLLDEYRVGVDGPWGRREASHLLRRAGFSPSEPELRRAVEDGPRATVERLLDAPADADSARHAELDAAGEAVAAREDIEQLAAWWLLRMCHTLRPLHARMAVFWHGHFATSNVKVNSPPMMLRQLRTIEAHGLGRFDRLLLAMSRDPAMIVWLDGDSNRKGKPNENYARELFELFSLGPGHYSEVDIREAARAFSGWHQKGGVFQFMETLHDGEPKTVFGRTGRWGGEQVVGLAVEQPASACFIARKLLREFVCDDPPAALVGELAEVLRESGLEIGAALRRLLTSRAFFDPRWRRGRIKSPVEFCVGLVRSFEMRVSGAALHRAASQMGQRLFEPPTVKGWDGHRRWLNASTMLVRMNAATLAAAGTDGRGLEAERWVKEMKLTDGGAALRFAMELMIDGDLPSAAAAVLRDACLDAPPASALRTAVAALAACPEYQMA